MDRDSTMAVARRMHHNRVNNMGSESFYFSVARCAFVGYREAGSPTDRDAAVRAAYGSLKQYYIAWGDWMNRMLAYQFADAVLHKA